LSWYERCVVARARGDEIAPLPIQAHPLRR